MKKHLLDKDSEEAIINRITKLDIVTEAAWGDMKVNEMLFHCIKVNRLILQAKPQNKTSTIKQRIMKTVGLHLIKAFPKGVKTGPKYLPELTDNIAFEKMQNELVENVREIARYTDAIYGQHPFFGPLNTKEWRRFMWKHLDHHLRQFNV